MAAPIKLTDGVLATPLQPGGEARQMLRDAGAGFSLANLCYFRIWSEILTYTPQNTFLMKSPPGRLEFIGVTLNVLLGGILLAMSQSRKST